MFYNWNDIKGLFVFIFNVVVFIGLAYILFQVAFFVFGVGWVAFTEYGTTFKPMAHWFIVAALGSLLSLWVNKPKAKPKQAVEPPSPPAPKLTAPPQLEQLATEMVARQGKREGWSEERIATATKTVLEGIAPRKKPVASVATKVTVIQPALPPQPVAEFTGLTDLTDAEQWVSARLGYIVRNGYQMPSGLPANVHDVRSYRELLLTYFTRGSQEQREAALSRAFTAA